MTRILIVDDRDDNLYFLRVLLQGNGYEVASAKDGADALVAAADTSFDLVVSDLLMPVMDGFSLLRKWKSDPRWKEVPFIVYTATYTEAEDERFALSLGADAFVVKPTEPEALLAIIREVLARSVSLPAPLRDQEGEEENPTVSFNRILIRKLEKKMLQLETAKAKLEEELLERIRTQEALEQSTSLVRIAGEIGRLGGWSLHQDHRLVWSDETCVMHDLAPGHTPTLEEAIAFYTAESREVVSRQAEDCLRDGTPFDFEHTLITEAGRKLYVRTIGRAVRGETGQIVGIQGAIQDITERKELEQKLLRADRMERIGTLAAGVAHDLNNLFVPILLAVDHLRAEAETEPVREMVQVIESSAQRGIAMVKQVLSLAQGVESTQDKIEIRELLYDIARTVRETFPNKIHLRTEIDEDLWDLVGDPSHLHQIFMNLFVNARDSMPNGGTISVRVENVSVDQNYAGMIASAVPGPYIRISVVDSGDGIPASLLDRIFEPFFTTKSEDGGTGLGLSTVAAIVRRYAGFISVYSEAGAGTTFRIHFPATLLEPSHGPAPSESELQQGNGECILIVDDEAAIRSITEQTLVAFGYRVLTATDGADAIAVFGRHTSEIDLVLTDTAMPIMDGPAAIRALLRIDPEVRVIVASGAGSETGVKRSRELGVAHFLPKPYTAHALLAVIHRALHPPEG